jgi:hypothetical protein
MGPIFGGISGGTNVNVSGYHLDTVSSVTVGDQPADFSQSSSGAGMSPDLEQMSFTTPAVDIPGAYDVLITNDAGSESPVDQFTYEALAEVNGVDPSSGPAVGGNQVTVTGQYFGTATEVWFGSSNATDFTILDPGVIQVNGVPAEDPGPVEVLVTNAEGDSTVVQIYTYE